MQEPEFKLHPEAAKAFDAMAEKLVELLEDFPTSPPGAASSFIPGVFVAGQISGKDIIGDFRVSLTVPVDGVEVGRLWVREGQRFGLRGEPFARFAQLVDKVRATSSLRDKASAECLRDLAFDWLLNRRLGASNISFSEHIILDLSKLVANFEIWLPAYKLFVQSDLAVGRIVFRTITKEMLDEYEKRIIPKPEDAKPQIDEHSRRFRKELQGIAAATITVFAEPIRASEIAHEEAQQALGLLRFFEPVNVLPEVRSYSTLLGEKNLPTFKYLILRDGRLFTYAERPLTKGLFDNALDAAHIAEIRAAGLDVLSDILGRESRTAFESALLDALLLYSKSALSADPADKLVYIFSALESLLLRDGNEPIQKNIGERLAWIVGTTVEERLRIVKDFTTVYGMRSRFVHHGSTPDNLETVRRFMHDSWCGLFSLVHETASFKSKLALIDELERKKMGGQ